MTMPYKTIFNTSLTLMLFAIVGSGLVAFSYQQTESQIERNQRQALLNTLTDLIPTGLYDNDLIQDTIEVANVGQLGSHEPVALYRARMNGQPVAVAFKPTARDGYSGDIQLLVAIHYDGRLLGVRVLSHQETPGLGDKIELRRSNWLLAFNDKSLNQPSEDLWKVKRDGGVFDQFTGATISPRAVVKAVKLSLDFFQVNRDKLFQ